MVVTDIVVLGLLLLYLVFGYRNGFLDGLVRIATLLAIIYLFVHIGDYVPEDFGGLGMSQRALEITLATLGAISLYGMSRVLRLMVSFMPNMAISRVMGMFVGVARFYVFMVIVMIASWTLPGTLSKAIWDGTESATVFAPTASEVLLGINGGDLVKTSPRFRQAGLDLFAGLKAKMPSEYYPGVRESRARRSGSGGTVKDGRVDPDVARGTLGEIGDALGNIKKSATVVQDLIKMDREL